MVSNPNNTFYGEYSLYLVSKGLVLVILELIFGALLESGAWPCTMLVWCPNKDFTIGVIPGLTRNPIFEAGFPLEFTPYLIRGGNDGLRITVKYC